MDPVWPLFYRRTFARAAYWLAALGYNVRDRSWSNRLYLVYFCVFWLIWLTAVFALLGASAASLFLSLKVAAPAAEAVWLGEIALTVWGWLQLWQAVRRSPFIFSEEDSFLLCQTPVSRRKVGGACFLQSWLGTALLFAAGTTVLTFALVELTARSGMGLARFLAYFSGSLRAVACVLPLQMAVQAGVWGIGAWRLDRRRPDTARFQTGLRRAVLGLGLALLAGIFVPGWRAVMLAPLRLPLEAAFAEPVAWAGWLGRAGLNLAYLGLSGWGLLAWSERMHLGWAAQETRGQAVIQMARRSGNFDLAQAVELRERLPAAPAPSRLPARPGAWMLVWKDVVQSWRSRPISQWLGWGWVFSLGLEIFRLSNWPAQLLLGGIWAIALSGLTTQRLRNDLAHWWLLRSLPLRPARLLLADLGLPCGLGIWLSWLGLALSGQPPGLVFAAAVLVPFLVAGPALAAAHDLVRHARVRDLMSPSRAAEDLPQTHLEGLIRSVLSAAVPLGLLGWSWIHPAEMGWALAAIPVSVMIVIYNLQAVISAYRWIE